MLIATPEAVLASVRAIYCNGYNEENQVSEKQYFHVAQAYFWLITYKKTGCESEIYILITGVYCSITFGFLCFIIRRYIPFYYVARMQI